MSQKGKLGDVEFQFNPANFEWTKEIEYADSPIMGMEVSPIEYTGGSGKNVPLELILDGENVKETVLKLDSYTEKGDSNAAPVLLFQFYYFMMDCVITSMKVVHMQFSPQPAKYDPETDTLVEQPEVFSRATIALTLRQYVKQEFHRTTREGKGERIYEVRSARFPVAGETFRNIAHREFKNAELAKAISDYNPEIMLQCVGPIIPAGMIVRIPPWSFAKQYLSSDPVGIVEFAG